MNEKFQLKLNPKQFDVDYFRKKVSFNGENLEIEDICFYSDFVLLWEMHFLLTAWGIDRITPAIMPQTLFGTGVLTVKDHSGKTEEINVEINLVIDRTEIEEGEVRKFSDSIMPQELSFHNSVYSLENSVLTITGTCIALF